MTKRANWRAWGLAAGLAVVVLAGFGSLGARLRWYWVARYRGARADLAGAYLARASLRGAELGNANLQHAVLSGADLRGANLSLCCLGAPDREGGAADLESANLGNANLRGCIGTISVLARLKVHGQISAVGRGPTKGSACRLRSSFVPENSGCCCAGIASIQPLSSADLRFADLMDADLRGANLNNALLGNTILVGADLRDADLRGAAIEYARLIDARYNAHTRWPAGFDPHAHGAVKVR